MFELTGIPDSQIATVLSDLELDGSRVVSRFRAPNGTWTLIIAPGTGSPPAKPKPVDGAGGNGTNTDTTGVEENDEFSTGSLIPGRPSIRLDTSGKIATGHDGLTIEYRGRDDCPYGISATQNRKAFAALVIHHTANDHDTDWYVQYQIDGDPGRDPPGHYGYHFYISPAGDIVQGAPLTVRTNHVSPSNSVRREFGRIAQNTNAIGITCVGAGSNSGFNPTKKQVKAVEQMVFALADVYSIPFVSVFGHGEIQSNRHREEGTSIAEAVRAW